MKNIKIERSFWQQGGNLLTLQCSTGGKLLNFTFTQFLSSEIFYDGFDATANEVVKDEVKNKVIKTIEAEDGKLDYLIQKALEDKSVQEELTKGNSASFSINYDHFYDHTDERGRRIHKDYRSKK